MYICYIYYTNFIRIISILRNEAKYVTKIHICEYIIYYMYTYIDNVFRHFQTIQHLLSILSIKQCINTSCNSIFVFISWKFSDIYKSFPTFYPFCFFPNFSVFLSPAVCLCLSVWANISPRAPIADSSPWYLMLESAPVSLLTYLVHFLLPIMIFKSFRQPFKFLPRLAESLGQGNLLSASPAPSLFLKRCRMFPSPNVRTLFNLNRVCTQIYTRVYTLELTPGS